MKFIEKPCRPEKTISCRLNKDKYYDKGEKGYSILEVFLTLAITSGVIYAIFSFYRNEKHVGFPA
ncbi:hypothetical protein IM880_10010 [Pectobacterium polaris]|uniref:Prepilin-type N-terminal cleavage/methylation domain-containing protein n=1 Tax=Pectobacterium polaris TaxID=2042057 RepID=A0AAW4NZP9_9GAMM|nr:hypothetical protein [Pectobacterium polaris]MBW5892547.1 hypothetical protein [Pectobacterium polaris]MCA6940523.1 hypothetical protein [Pectobacterium polaris]MCA6956110.1 hypothetical protein [Pectobacterium polaris]